MTLFLTIMALKILKRMSCWVLPPTPMAFGCAMNVSLRCVPNHSINSCRFLLGFSGSCFSRTCFLSVVLETLGMLLPQQGP